MKVLPLILSLIVFTRSARGLNETIYGFPESFKFGAASSAYQIEGGWDADGKSASIWDTFTHSDPNRIEDKSNGDVAADSFHFYRKDIDALRTVGFHYYRFSISWPRILRNGFVLNRKGIEYYNNLINALLEADIEPVVTMFHWDLPQQIQDLGGFTNPLIIDHFIHYADVLFENFGDRVKRWVTFNEPFIFCIMGYSEGAFAPGIKSPGIGISLDSRFVYPRDETVDADLTDKVINFRLGWFANPIFSKDGGYPQGMIDKIGNKSKTEGRRWSRLPTFTEGMKKKLIGSADFMGLNYYTSRYIVPNSNETFTPSFDNDVGVKYLIDPSWSRAKSSWLYSVPQGLHDILQWIRLKYGNPLVTITENGFSDDGQLDDDGRVEFLKAHLASVSRAVSEGCNINGYTAWSIVDSFEWLSGFSDKFGLFAVNSTSELKERTMKKSAEFFKQLIAENHFLL